MATDATLEADQQLGRPRSFLGDLFSTDYRKLGLFVLVTSLLFAVVSLVVGEVLRAELLTPDANILKADSDGQLFNLHVSAGLYLFLIPAFLGLATAIVPAQLGSNSSALPRLSLFGRCCFTLGGLGLLVSYLIGGGPWSAQVLLDSRALLGGGVGNSSELWLVSFALVLVALISLSINLVATVARMKPRGVELSKLPAFSTSSAIAGLVTIISAAITLGGVVLAWVHFHQGGAVLTGAAGEFIWRHTLWVYGQPMVYVPAIAGLGVLTDVLVSASRRRSLAHNASLVLIGVIGALSLLALVQTPDATSSVFLPLTHPSQAFDLVAVGLLSLIWLATLAAGKPRFGAALVLGIVATVPMVGAGLLAVKAAVSDVESGNQFTSAFVHLFVFLGPLVGLFAGLYHWSKPLTGRFLKNGGGLLAALLLLVGSLAGFVPSIVMTSDQPRLVGQYADGLDTSWAHAVQFGGGLAIGLAVLLVLGAFLGAIVAKSTEDDDSKSEAFGQSLEWLASRGPTRFDVLPEIVSERPLADSELIGAKS